jgi:hypothetical protein
MKMLPALWNRQEALLLMAKEATFTNTGAAILAIEFLAVANLVPAFTAFDGAIDQLKHLIFRASPLERAASEK